MSTSRGRHCRRCDNRISRRIRLCHICGALNLKPVDYVLASLLAAAVVHVLWRWL